MVASKGIQWYDSRASKNSRSHRVEEKKKKSKKRKKRQIAARDLIRQVRSWRCILSYRNRQLPASSIAPSYFSSIGGSSGAILSFQPIILESLPRWLARSIADWAIPMFTPHSDLYYTGELLSKNSGLEQLQSDEAS